MEYTFNPDGLQINLVEHTNHGRAVGPQITIEQFYDTFGLDELISISTQLSESMADSVSGDIIDYDAFIRYKNYKSLIDAKIDIVETATSMELMRQSLEQFKRGQQP